MRVGMIILSSSPSPSFDNEERERGSRMATAVAGGLECPRLFQLFHKMIPNHPPKLASLSGTHHRARPKQGLSADFGAENDLVKTS